MQAFVLNGGFVSNFRKPPKIYVFIIILLLPGGEMSKNSISALTERLSIFFWKSNKGPVSLCLHYVRQPVIYHNIYDTYIFFFVYRKKSFKINKVYWKGKITVSLKFDPIRFNYKSYIISVHDSIHDRFLSDMDCYKLDSWYISKFKIKIKINTFYKLYVDLIQYGK